MPSTTDTIETPAVVIDEAIARRNIDAFQRYCDDNNLTLRPHIKTHKLPHFARIQLAAGAKGITCQKIGEAEIMADAGLDEILITYNILGQPKLVRLLALSQRVAKLEVVADNLPVIEGLASTFTDAAKPLSVMVECDTGGGRCGVQTPQDAAELAAAIHAAPGLTFGGLMTYPPVGGAAAVDAFMTAAKAMLDTQNIPCAKVSSGGSPDMWSAADASTVTEYRAGTYIYNDRSLVERGVCTWDECALSVFATVVSTPEPGRAIIDAGSKVLTSDLLGLDGYGHVLGYPQARVVSLSEEHGIIHHDGTKPFTVGDRITIIPNHVCVVSNMVDKAWLKTDTGSLKEIEIAARGTVT